MWEKIKKLEDKMFYSDIASAIFWILRYFLFSISAWFVIYRQDFRMGYYFILLVLLTHYIGYVLYKYSTDKEDELMEIIKQALDSEDEYALDILEKDGFIKKIEKENEGEAANEN